MIKTGNKIFALFIFMVPFYATGGTCPDGYYTLSRSNIILSPTCSSNSTDLGAVVGTCDNNSATCSPDVVCRAAHALRAGNSVSVPLYSAKYSSPSLAVAMGDTTCYASMVPGEENPAINVIYGDTTWHTVGLRRCLELSSGVVPTMTAPGANTIVWRGVSGNANLVGTSQCATNSGAIGDTNTALNTTSADTSKYCWCRILAPVYSKWVYAEAYSGIGACNTSCVAACANAFADNDRFRDAIISGVK